VDRPYQLAHSGGLALLVNPNGSRWWRWRYHVGAKERGISLRVYLDVSEKRDAASPLSADGIDRSNRRQDVGFWRTLASRTLRAATLDAAFASGIRSFPVQTVAMHE
jgi:hypothetical protein